MVARSGLFVAPATSVGASPTDARLALSALIGTTAQQASGGVTVQSASVLTFTVPSSVWQLPDVTNAGASFLSATDPFVLTAAAGPGTGSRVDLICVKQNNIENGDADSRANVILVAGTAGAPGVAPTVPTGAWLYQTINVPTSAATASACTVVAARPSTYAPLPIKATTLALLNLVTGQPAQHATVTADGTSGNNGDYVWTTAWTRPIPAMSHAEFTFNRSAIGDGTTTVFSTVTDAANSNDLVFATITGATGNTVTLPSSGVYSIDCAALVAAASTGPFSVSIVVSGVAIAQSYTPSGTNTLSASASNFRAAAGAVVSISITKTTGGTADINSRVRVTRLASF